MKNTPVTISIFLLLFVGAISIWLSCTESLALSASELVQAEITLLATLGALISATFVVWSYIQTNMAFLEGKRPQLLIQVVSQKLAKSQDDQTLVPSSVIQYRNLTLNQFKDLNIIVKIESVNRSIDLSDLFKKNMVMIGYDFRARRFSPIELLSERGMNLTELAASGNEVIMKITYDHRFLNKKETVQCQEYKWDPNIQEWIIP